MRIARTLLAIVVAIGPGCKKKNAEPVPTETGSSASMTGSAAVGSAMVGSAAGSAMAGSDVGSATAVVAAGSGDGSGTATAMAHHAGNCPSTVLGSTTKAEVKGKDVVVTITSDDPDAISAIQRRTDEMLKARMEKHDGVAHDQRGTHGGSIGLCPVHIPEGATATPKHEKNGVTVTITPKDKPDDLKAIIDARIARSAEWVKQNIKPADKGDMGGVGGGKGDHGSNHSGQGDAKGQIRKNGDGGGGGGAGTGGGGGKGTGGGSAKNK